MADLGRLQSLGLVEVPGWTAAAPNRVQREAVNVTDLVSTAEELMQDKVFDKSRDIILGNLLKAGATSSSVMLMFTYKALFEAMSKCPVVRS